MGPSLTPLGKLLLSVLLKLFTPSALGNEQRSSGLAWHEMTDCTDYAKTAAFLQMERLPCDGDIWQAEAAAAAGPCADLQFMSSCPPQEGLVATHLFKHQDQELEHHDGKVAESVGREEKRDEKRKK